MSKFDPRDKSKTAVPRRDKLVNSYRSPPKGTPWIWLTEDFIFSPAYKSLSANAQRVLWRVIGEYLNKNRNENGRLIVTHPDFVAYGATGRLIADAIDELIFKGLIRARRGKAADGTSHPTLFRMTFFGDFEGSAPTHDWKALGPEDVERWAKVRASRALDRAEKAGRKKKSSIHESEIAHFTKVKLPGGSGGFSA